jgi:pimeloyl-ACP methyl ester carboxylesterase
VTGRRVEFSAFDGLRLAAAEWPGDAARTPLFCLPGICRTALDFEAIGARHGGARRVVALDYAGHGESARATDPRRYPAGGADPRRAGRDGGAAPASRGAARHLLRRAGGHGDRRDAADRPRRRGVERHRAAHRTAGAGGR